MYNQIDSNKRRTWLLIVVFTLVVMLIGWFFGYYFDYGYGPVVIALIFSLGMTLLNCFWRTIRFSLQTTSAKISNLSGCSANIISHGRRLLVPTGYSYKAI